MEEEMARAAAKIAEGLDDLSEVETKAISMKERIKKFFQYSFEDIHFDYEGLSMRERGLCTKPEFYEMLEWVGFESYADWKAGQE